MSDGWDVLDRLVEDDSVIGLVLDLSLGPLLLLTTRRVSFVRSKGDRGWETMRNRI